ncbi:Putative ATP-binding protein [Giardia duodenalis]|uniref:Putative ATP-binding protein n=1 Tax=Giardia intestinalis TaxID=5741 RepID=V6T7M1_GIAIN|nr:Putative ATP-binding protein [Giardia intestinalis]
MDLPPLPQTLQYGSWIGFTESIHAEFKALQETNQPLRKVIGNYFRECLNAFPNTYGGYLLFGVDDRGHVHRLLLSASEADETFLVIDNSLNQMRPQPGGVIQEVALIPVTNREEKNTSSLYASHREKLPCISHQPPFNLHI